jgi:hypothetical protein
MPAAFDRLFRRLERDAANLHPGHDVLKIADAAGISRLAVQSPPRAIANERRERVDNDELECRSLPRSPPF